MEGNKPQASASALSVNDRMQMYLKSVIDLKLSELQLPDATAIRTELDLSRLASAGLRDLDEQLNIRIRDAIEAEKMSKATGVNTEASDPSTSNEQQAALGLREDVKQMIVSEIDNKLSALADDTLAAVRSRVTKQVVLIGLRVDKIISDRVEGKIRAAIKSVAHTNKAKSTLGKLFKAAGQAASKMNKLVKSPAKEVGEVDGAHEESSESSNNSADSQSRLLSNE